MELQKKHAANTVGMSVFRLTCRRGGAGRGRAGCPLMLGVADSPLHGPGSLGSAVGVGAVRGSLQRLIEHKGLLLYVVTLTTAAIGITRVI